MQVIFQYYICSFEIVEDLNGHFPLHVVRKTCTRTNPCSKHVLSMRIGPMSDRDVKAIKQKTKLWFEMKHTYIKFVV